MNAIIDILKESGLLLNKMSIYLIFGFIVAGILHIFLRTDTIARHLGKGNVSSVVKASLFGIPLPLCSCGVLPAALSLRKEGASRGAVLSFLISTPTTGIDSIFATYALLGGFFAFYRVLASFVAGVFAGLIANLLFKDKKDEQKDEKTAECKLCGKEEHSEKEHSLSGKVKGAFKYAFGELLSDVGPWLVIGIIVGGVISYILPESFIKSYLGSGWQAMVVMFVVGIPMYVCSSGSIPIAAALMLKGMSPGAAFVFLLAGPATNSVALTVIAKRMGKETVFIFLFSIMVCGFGLGIFLNYIWGYLGINVLEQVMHHSKTFPYWLEVSGSILLMLLILVNIFSSRKTKKKEKMVMA